MEMDKKEGIEEFISANDRIRRQEERQIKRNAKKE